MISRALVLLLPLLAACGSQTEEPRASDPEPAAPVVSGDYVAEGVPGWPDGATIRLTVGDGEIRFRGDCNEFSGPASWQLDGNRSATVDFDAGPFAGTELGCAPAAMARDDWMTRFFERASTITLDGTDVALRDERTEIWFVPAAETGGQEEPAVPLEGTDWRLTSIGADDGDTGSILEVPGSVRSTVSIADGNARFATGCNGGNAAVTVEGDELRVSPGMLTQVACTGIEDQVEAAVLRVWGRAGRVTWRISGESLTVSTRDGRHQLHYDAS